MRGKNALFPLDFLNKCLMTITTAKVQKTSDLVYNSLKKQGFSKYFNWIDYRYFKSLAKREHLTGAELAEKIVFYFINYNNETSDFADYDF